MRQPVLYKTSLVKKLKAASTWSLPLELQWTEADAENAYRVLCRVIRNELIEGKGIDLHNIGKLTLKRHKAKIGRNPKKPEQPINIPERTVVKFTPDKHFHVALQGVKAGNPEAVVVPLIA